MSCRRLVSDQRRFEFSHFKKNDFVFLPRLQTGRTEGTPVIPQIFQLNLMIGLGTLAPKGTQVSMLVEKPNHLIFNTTNIPPCLFIRSNNIKYHVKIPYSCPKAMSCIKCIGPPPLAILPQSKENTKIGASVTTR